MHTIPLFNDEHWLGKPMDDDQELRMTSDQIDAIIQYSPLGELTQVLAQGIAGEEPGTLVARIKIHSLNDLASRWLVRGLTTNFYSFLLEMSQQLPNVVEMDDEYIYLYTFHPANRNDICEITNALAVRYFVYDIEEEIHGLGANSMRKMLEELATLLAESVNPFLLEPATIN